MAGNLLLSGGQDYFVSDGDRPALALLGDVVEHHAITRHCHVPLLQRGRAVVMVQLGILSPPIRNRPRSISRTALAATRSRSSPPRVKSSTVAARNAGRTLANRTTYS